MTTSARDEPSLVSEVLTELESAEQFEASPPPRNGAVKWGLRAGLALLLVGLVTAGFATLRANLGAASNGSLQTYVVKRGGMLVTITEDGNLESADNLDIKCEVAGGSTILWIIEDGKEVAQGAEIVRLDSAQLEEQINQQRIAYEKARATHIQAEKDYEVAKIAVQEYLEGTYRQQLQDLEANITIALANLGSAENSLQYTERMFRKGYVSPLQLETQKFAVERAKLDLASAKTAKDVLERFTKAKTLQGLESQRDTAEAKKNAEKAAFDLEEGKLKRLEGYLKKCVIRAPKAGMVVYANEQSRGRFGPQQGVDIKEGAQVREQQTILRLPDLTKMQVKVAVHESKVERIRPRMRARIRIQDKDFQGTVTSVASQPEPTSFFSAAVKEYATTVKIDGEPRDLRPGMTAEVEILVATLDNVLSVPVAAVFEQGGQTFCCVKRGNKIEPRRVLLGMSNNDFVQIMPASGEGEAKVGLEEGEEVVLNPRAFVKETGEAEREKPAVDVQKRFGTASPEPAASPPGADRPGAGPRPAGPAMPAERPDGKGGPPGDRGKTPSKTFDPMRLDANGDGKITRDELPGPMAEAFDQIDTDKSGDLSVAEMRSWFTKMRGQFPRAPRGGPDAGPGGPAP